MVDEREEALDLLGEPWRGGFVLGHGMDTGVLEQAGVDSADMLVAATDGDNTNLVVAQVAKRRFNVPKVVVRVLDPARAKWYGEQGLQTICPTAVAIEMLTEAVRETAV